MIKIDANRLEDEAVLLDQIGLIPCASKRGYPGSVACSSVAVGGP